MLDLDRYRRTVQHAIASTPAKGIGPYQVALALREVFPRDTIATIDTGSHRILINHVWQSFEPAPIAAVEWSRHHGLCVAISDCSQAHVPEAAGACDDGRSGPRYGAG
jgi:acetolactate synthase-1/2/3 large subunit